ncbi:MAG TPA: chromosome partitioning protein [Kribbellaceae bacterium]|jgi:MinD-like ATPase involved in chromosome partitioning or flagellar assembly
MVGRTAHARLRGVVWGHGGQPWRSSGFIRSGGGGGPPPPTIREFEVVADSQWADRDAEYGDVSGGGDRGEWEAAHARAAAADSDGVADREQEWAAHNRAVQTHPYRTPQPPAPAVPFAPQPGPVPGTPQPGPLPGQVPGAPVPGQSYNADELISSLPAHREAPAEKGVRAKLRMRPGAAERSERQARDIAATSFRRPVTVVVANPKGGSGKTPVTLLLAGAFGQARGGGVVAWDNNELRGNMHLRTHDTNPRATVPDMLRAMPMLRKSDARLGDVAAYLRHQVAGQYDALTSSRTTYAQIDAADFHQIHDLLSRFYRMLVIDTGNNEGSSNWREAMRMADALVIPIKWKSLSCAAAVQMLEELERQGEWAEHLTRNAVVAVSHGPGEVNRDVEKRLRPYFESRAGAVIDIPTDLHIAEEGPLDHAALQPATRRAALELASRVADQIRVRLNDRP